jgi:hypothetical protein
MPYGERLGRKLLAKNDGYESVICKDCEASGSYAVFNEEAVELWNKRIGEK